MPDLFPALCDLTHRANSNFKMLIGKLLEDCTCRALGLDPTAFEWKI
jgi:hypothetical protein